MERNFFQRVETCFPIESKRLRKRVMEDLNLYLGDNSQAWLLQNDGSYVKVQPEEGEEVCSAQQALLEKYAVT
jgi:polyphosphate kinase